MKRKLWSKSEIESLIENFSIKTNEELAILFPNRTRESIKIKGKKLNLKKSNDVELKNRSFAHIGDKNGMYGKRNMKPPLTDKQKKTLSVIRIKMFADGKINISGEKNGMFGKIPYNKGKKASLETCLNISKAIKKYWNDLSVDEKNNKITQLRNEWKTKPFKYNISDSKPERLIEELLISMNVNYNKKVYVGHYNCDFIVDNNFVIEVQGDYFHANPKFFPKNINRMQENNTKRDKIKSSYLIESGYYVLYLWEDDIIHDINKCTIEIKNRLYGKAV